jgi:hypothetical protein
VLECRGSDESVCARAVELVAERGGFVTLVAVVPPPVPWLNAGPHCTPTITAEDRLLQAADALARAVAAIPPEIPVVTCVEHGRARRAVLRRIEIAQPDVVVARRRRVRRPQLRLRLEPVPAVAR